MLTFIIVIFLIFVCVNVPIIPFFFKNIANFVKWGFIDIFFYFSHKEYNRCKLYGKISLISAYRNKVFGSGKTLDLSMTAHEIYKAYDNLPVWSESENKFVPQRIHLISNIQLNGVPYTKFTSVKQFLNVEQNPEDVTLFIFDEIGAIWNSREYKTNLSTELVRALLQVRHNKIGIIGTTQRFKFVDALLRQITGSLLCVNKTWRVLKIMEYDPVDYENAPNYSILKPLSLKYKFVLNKDYLGYDTNEVVGDLLKLDLLPDDEVLQNQSLVQPDIDVVSTGRIRKRYFKRRLKK